MFLRSGLNDLFGNELFCYNDPAEFLSNSKLLFFSSNSNSFSSNFWFSLLMPNMSSGTYSLLTCTFSSSSPIYDFEIMPKEAPLWKFPSFSCLLITFSEFYNLSTITVCDGSLFCIFESAAEKESFWLLLYLIKFSLEVLTFWSGNKYFSLSSSVLGLTTPDS